MNLPPIHIKDYNYELEDHRIAKYPLENRSSSKLLYYNNGNIEHKMFTELPELLPDNTLLVINDTKVIEARLRFKKNTGADIEVFLLNPADHKNASIILGSSGTSVWECLIGNKKRWKDEDVLYLSDEHYSITARWKDREKNQVELYYDKFSLAENIHALGDLPIPPYLNRATEEIDLTRYQTSFAKNEGSVAAPTAALHFDEKIKKQIFAKGHSIQFLTLHVGAGTFKPVTAENAIDHSMHEEFISFKREFIQSLLDHDGPIVPVGTTSLRSLESLYWFGIKIILNNTDKLGAKILVNEFKIEQYFPYDHLHDAVTAKKSFSAVLEWMDKNDLKDLEGTSSIYIVPGYKPQVANGIITNFHQPQSTLLLLISALVGNSWKNIYRSALNNNYRFLSYGDSSLLLF